MTPRHADHDVVVIGAGPAGTTVADSLERAGRDVLVIDGGGPNDHPALSSANFFDARLRPEAWRTDVSVRHTLAQDWRPYRQGNGFGGSAAVNAMVCMPGDEWDDQADRSAAQELMASTSPYRPTGATLGAALLSAWGGAAQDFAQPRAAGAGPPPLWTDSHVTFARRRLLAPRQLLHSTEVLTIEPGAQAKVQTAAGTMTANAVVLCAGAIQTAHLVSKIAPAGSVGNAVQDHPAIRLTVRLAEQARLSDPTLPVVSCTARWRSRDNSPDDGTGAIDLQLLALDATGTGPSDTVHGVVMVALMDPLSRGRLSFASDGSALLDLAMLDHPMDRARLREGLRRLIDLLTSPSMRSVAEEVFVDDHGTLLGTFNHLYTDDKFTDQWMMETAGDYSHIVGSCPAGLVTGTGATLGLVRGTENIWVADASLFTRIPTANTMVPTMVLARSVARRIGGR